MTEYKRFELLDGVYLTAVRTDTCDRGCMSMTFLTQLSRETAAMNAVIPQVLLRGLCALPARRQRQRRGDSLPEADAAVSQSCADEPAGDLLLRCGAAPKRGRAAF